MKAALYTRVSILDLNPDLRVEELQAYAERQGWEIVETYQDIISGAKTRRPGLDRLMEDTRLNRFDRLLVGKLDRKARKRMQRHLDQPSRT